jgi:protein arginine N-methyltransferase 7
MEAAAARHAATLAANPRTHLGAEAFSKKDDRRVDDDERAEESSEEKTKEAPTREAPDPERETYTHAGSVAEDGECTRAVVPACAPPTNDDEKETEGGSKGSTGERREHYWGQAVQYLERGVQVRANKKVTLLARREADACVSR